MACICDVTKETFINVTGDIRNYESKRFLEMRQRRWTWKRGTYTR
jgi:hypothetical protein